MLLVDDTCAIHNSAREASRGIRTEAHDIKDSFEGKPFLQLLQVAGGLEWADMDHECPLRAPGHQLRAGAAVRNGDSMSTPAA